MRATDVVVSSKCLSDWVFSRLTGWISVPSSISNAAKAIAVRVAVEGVKNVKLTTLHGCCQSAVTSSGVSSFLPVSCFWLWRALLVSHLCVKTFFLEMPFFPAFPARTLLLGFSSHCCQLSIGLPPLQ